MKPSQKGETELQSLLQLIGVRFRLRPVDRRGERESYVIHEGAEEETERVGEDEAENHDAAVEDANDHDDDGGDNATVIVRR